MSRDDDFLLSRNSLESDVNIDDEEPVDHGNIVYLCMILLGCGLLFPYNAMITADDYFEHIWPKKGLASFAPFLANCLSPFLQLFMVRFSHLLPYRLRAVGGFTLYTIATILVPLVAELINNRDNSYFVAMGLMIIIGASNAILSNTIFSMGAQFPPKYSQGVMAGNGWSGLIVCAIRILTKLFFKEDDHGFRLSALCFFGASSFVCLSCIIAYIYVVNSSFSKHYFTEKQNNTQDKPSINDPLLDFGAKETQEQPSMIAVLGKAWPAVLNIVAVFIMTFLVFPGTLIAHNAQFSWIPSSWWAVTVISFFNVLDLIGRSLPAYFIAVGAENLHFCVFGRFLLYPLFIFLGPAHVLENTWILFIALALFSASNGYLSTLSFIHSGSYVKENERATLGGLMSIGLTAGITLGSLSSQAIDKLFF